MPVYTLGRTEITYEARKSNNLVRRYIEVTPDRVVIIVQQSNLEYDINEFLKRKERWFFDQT